MGLGRRAAVLDGDFFVERESGVEEEHVGIRADVESFGRVTEGGRGRFVTESAALDIDVAQGGVNGVDILEVGDFYGTGIDRVTVRTPDQAAIFAAASFDAMPPLPRTEPAVPAMRSSS